ncbi:MAG TPA: hypothetical protein VM841_10980 [Actinomycetota bacterium]|nr:hypothetical protein [Actinomycetota bacterium]
MEYVTTDPEIDGLGAMLADLVRANIAAHPERAKLLENVSGTINVKAIDAGVAVGLEFAANRFNVFAKPFRRAGLEIITDSGTLMELTAVPLWKGQPDVRTPEGRTVLRKMVRRDLRIKGAVAHPMLLNRLQRLLSAV